jgi:hypothetical protein
MRLDCGGAAMRQMQIKVAKLRRKGAKMGKYNAAGLR